MNEEQIKEMQEAAKKKVNEAVEQMKATLNEEQKTQLDELKNTLNTEFSEKLEGLKNEEEVKGIVEEATKEMTEKLQELEGIVETQGKKIKDGQKVVNMSLTQQFKEKYSDKGYNEEKNTINLGSAEKGERGELFKIETKAFDSLNTITVNDVPAGTYPANGAVSAIGNTVRSAFAQLFGFMTKPRPYSKIMDLVNFQPLTAEKLILWSNKVSGKFEITPECAIKKDVTVKLEVNEVTAEPVAALWYTTLQIRRFYNNILNGFRRALEDLLGENVPTEVLTKIKALANPLTVAPNTATETAPNDLDALIVAIASLESAGFMPDGLIFHPVVWGNLMREKGNDGHYKNENYGSIQVLANGIIWNGRQVQMVLDNTLQPDEFMVGDFANSVYVGLDDEIFYLEIDGRTDGEATVSTGLSRNIRTHALEQFMAVGVPTEWQEGLILDTFTNVKNQIIA